MKAVILAGGLGSRLMEETVKRPKPMIEIGGKPILWHIMNIFSSQGINEFIIVLGYKGSFIKEYFLNYFTLDNDISIDLSTGTTKVHDGKQPKWKIHLVDTGLHTQTGGRLKRIKSWLDLNEPFMFTYGDGVADLPIQALLKFHRAHGKLATVTTVHAPARFGRIAFKDDMVMSFQEKENANEGWINGGFFVLQPDVLDFIDGDDTPWEREPVERLASLGQLMGFRHSGFWSCMDTLKEKNLLEDLWHSEKPPWKVW